MEVVHSLLFGRVAPDYSLRLPRTSQGTGDEYLMNSAAASTLALSLGREHLLFEGL